jgi:hypothetical protein
VRRLVGYLLFALASGCSTPCEEALDRIESAVVACELAAQLPPFEPNVDCADDDASALARQAGCVEAAECPAIDGSDPAGHRALSECVAGVGEPEE